ncbi:MAG: hypothetical protein PVI90_00865 [Desulfobacteraceae bacterium]|jgi:hypothetical protein
MRGVPNKKTKKEEIVENVFGKNRPDGRLKGSTMIEDLVNKHPQLMMTILRRLEAKLGEMLTDENDDLSEDDLLLLQIETETLAMRALMGKEISNAQSLVDENGKTVSSISSFNQMTRIILQILGLRHRKKVSEDDKNEPMINVRDLWKSTLGPMTKENE